MEEIIYNIDNKVALDQIAAGDEFAFAQLFDFYRDKVFAIALKLTGVRSAAEDVVQEVFLKIWLNREKLTEVTYFKAYLNTITTNHVYNMLRKVGNEYCFLTEMLSKEQVNTSDTLTLSAFHELQDIVHRAIAQLPMQQKKVYLLSREEGLKYAEIADKLHIAPSTVKSHMIEALRNLKTQLKANGVEISLPVFIFIGAATVVAQA